MKTKSGPCSSCQPVQIDGNEVSLANKGLLDLDIGSLSRELASIDAAAEDVYGYVVRTVGFEGTRYVQEGSAPNFNGGLITLCTCKHGMRSALTPGQWKQGVWVAGFTSWDRRSGKQQSLVYLMRVGEAYASQADLVQALRQSGRASVVQSKNSTLHPLGDLMLPASASLAGADRFSPSAYRVPVLHHAHRRTDDDCGWHDDINYSGYAGRQPAMLVGDERFSFAWTHPVVKRREPGPTRPYRKWTLSTLLEDLEDVAQ